ncbi:MAG: hypothetical protein ACK5KO_02010 [Arachnia sp.]
MDESDQLRLTEALHFGLSEQRSDAPLNQGRTAVVSDQPRRSVGNEHPDSPALDQDAPVNELRDCAVRGGWVEHLNLFGYSVH